MIRKLVLATGLFAAVAFASSVQTASSATLVGPHTPIPALDTTSPIEQVQWVGGCRRVARICSNRWGWGGPDFRRCMRRRAC
jgi:hypothetical protein